MRVIRDYNNYSICKAPPLPRVLQGACVQELVHAHEESFQQRIEACQGRMEKCIRLERDYCEEETM